MAKIVVNRCFGGFGLSFEARELLYAKGCLKHAHDADTYFGIDASFNACKAESDAVRAGTKPALSMMSTHVTADGKYVLTDHDSEYTDTFRSDPTLVAVVEELGERANGAYAELVVVEIPDDVDWYIHDYDGQETVRENHRSW